MLQTKKYPAVAYRQARDPNANWIVSFVTSADDLVQWAGVPRRTQQIVTGFQRLEDDARIKRAQEFFRMGLNQSPTALIVGIHPIGPGSEKAVELRFLDSDEDSSVRQAELIVSYDDSEQNLEAIRARIREQIRIRLTQDAELDASDDSNEAQEDATEEAAIPEEREDDSDDEDEEEEGEDDANGSFELGRSQLHDLLKKLEDPEWCASNEEHLRDIAKPATIIDGQHRVMGAFLCERDIPFTVCALYDCSWAEQVFQFTVVNYTAKGIPDQFITANAALSLTETELQALQHRLVQANVKVLEYELMKVVHFDERSPFFNLVNLTEKKDDEKIGYKTMVRVAKQWYSASGRNNPIATNLLPNLFPDIRGKAAKSKRLVRWKESGLWGEFFCDFWRAVRDAYVGHPSHVNGHSLWDVGYSNLMIAIVLFELQEHFFLDLTYQDEEFFEVPDEEESVDFLRRKLRNRASKFIQYYPAKFWATEWKTKSLNTSAGRKALASALDELQKSKGKYQYESSQLVTGNID